MVGEEEVVGRWDERWVELLMEEDELGVVRGLGGGGDHVGGWKIACG